MYTNNQSIRDMYENGDILQFRERPNEWYQLKGAKGGSCDGCWFHNNDELCPSKAITLCTSNEGYVFERAGEGDGQLKLF
jgi:hypothetical protein